jgi:hypothetical protein
MTEENPFDDDEAGVKTESTTTPVKAPESPAKAPTAVPEGRPTLEVGTDVGVTLKSGKGYEAPWITFKGDTVYHVLSQFKGWAVEETRAKYPVTSDALVALIKEVNGAAIAFQTDYEKRGGAPAKGTYGKPANADKKPAEDPEESADVPFDDAGDSAAGADPMMACEHGTRNLVEWKGKKYHVCPLGKGKPGYCGAIEG